MKPRAFVTYRVQRVSPRTRTVPCGQWSNAQSCKRNALCELQYFGLASQDI
jgi:hypothetical protein